MALSHAVGWGLLFAALAADAGSLAAAMTGDAQSAYDEGQFEEARRIWVPLAEAGDAEAQVRLGLLFDLGQGVPKDLATAFMWYRRAAEAGLAQAQFNVAVMQDSGLVGPRNAVEAARWYTQAAAQGHHRAQYNLAQLYASGDGVPSNIAQAKAWYRVAAHGGLTAAADKLAEIERNARSGTSPSEPAPVVPPVLTVNAAINVSEDEASEFRSSQTDEASTRAALTVGTAGQGSAIQWPQVEQAHLATPQLGLSAEPSARLPAAASAPEQPVQVQSAQADEALGDDEPRTVRLATGVPPPLKNADFLWPVSGKVIGSFGPIDQWRRRDGIDIGLHAGAPPCSPRRTASSPMPATLSAGTGRWSCCSTTRITSPPTRTTRRSWSGSATWSVAAQVIARVGDSGDTTRSIVVQRR